MEQTAKKQAKFIVSGGGTGGHIFPAISIANALKQQLPDSDILFVGAENRMEMERVPKAGYRIVGLPVSGFDRKHLLRNVKTLFNAARSLRKARGIVKNFKPDVAIGVGGYASGPLLKAAASMGVPTLLQEQNSYAGVTNKMLADKADCICVAYKGMERFFPAEKIILTGNPVRQDLLNKVNREEAFEHFGLVEGKPVLLVVGGSLGAGTINRSMMRYVDELEASGIQVIWQTGRYYINGIKQQLKDKELKYIHVMEFIDRMDYAYNVANLVISRAGAGTISELCLLGEAVILVPSPNVAEDHQTKNAMALVQENAAIMVTDAQAEESLVPSALDLLGRPAQNQSGQPERLTELAENILKLAQHDSAQRIAAEVIKLMK